MGKRTFVCCAARGANRFFKTSGYAAAVCRFLGAAFASLACTRAPMYLLITRVVRAVLVSEWVTQGEGRFSRLAAYPTRVSIECRALAGGIGYLIIWSGIGFRVAMCFLVLLFSTYSAGCPVIVTVCFRCVFPYVLDCSCKSARIACGIAGMIKDMIGACALYVIASEIEASTVVASIGVRIAMREGSNFGLLDQNFAAYMAVLTLG